jgi:hypothetical protein
MTTTVSKRMTITVPDSVYIDLEVWAEHQGRPTANLAAYLIEVGIRDAKRRGEFKSQDDRQSQLERSQGTNGGFKP